MNKLKEIRLKHGYTQKEIANVLEITTQGYANYEQNLRQPDIETLKKISQYFRVSIDELVGNDITPFVSTWQLSEEQQANLYLIQKLSTKYNLIANGVLLRLFQEQQNEVV